MLEDGLDVDTASETAYKVKYRSLFSFNAYKKPIFSPGKPIAFINANIHLNLMKFLTGFGSVFRFCAYSLRAFPDIIIANRRLLI
jgi:hypothetical protein